MIRYLSCTHDHAADRLTVEEQSLFVNCKGIIITENNATRFEECTPTIPWQTGRNFKAQPNRKKRKADKV